MAAKIVIVGSIAGKFDQAFSKLASLQSKQNFSFAIVVGDLFASEQDDAALADLLEGKITIPLPTYFTIGVNSLPKKIIEILEKDEDICPDLHYLGKRSTTKTSEGVKIVTLGGKRADSNGISTDKFEPSHRAADARSLIGAHSADILLTSLWPASIAKGSSIAFPDGTAQPEGALHVAELAAALKPRYHFSSSPDLFYEREPFFHPPTDDDPDQKSITRFYSLASWGNSTKQKSIYAFNLQPASGASVTLPAGCTVSPFLNIARRQRSERDGDNYSRYSHSGGDQRHNRHKKQRFQKKEAPRPDECFFCLSNPNLATHLVASIGDEAYVAGSKGPLATSETFSNVGLEFPCHLLIIPFHHSPTLASIDEDDSRSKTYQEMEKYKSALQTMVSSRSSGKLGAVTYEISRNNGVHTHWQFLPMHADTIQKGLVEAGFRVEAENSSYPAFTARHVGLGLEDGDFFRVWIWSPAEEGQSEGTTKCLMMPLDEGLRFDLQFGRKVLGKLLSLEKRTHWRDCPQDDAEEKADIEAFKKAFKEFDFSLG